MVAGPGSASSCQERDSSASPLPPLCTWAKWHLLHGEGGGDPQEGEKWYREANAPRPELAETSLYTLGVLVGR